MNDVLPQELIDIIIDYLWDDHPVLRKLALVHRDWLSASRYHSFRRVTIGDAPRDRSWLELLDSPLATFLVHVRHISVGGVAANYNLRQSLGFWKHPKLVNVCSLYFSTVQIDGERLQSSDVAGIKELYIQFVLPRMVSVSIPYLISTLSAFQSLELLKIYSWYPDDEMQASASLPSSMPMLTRLQSLTIEDGGPIVEPILHWLKPPISLRQFMIRVDTSETNLRELGNFLRQSSKTLVKINLAITRYYDENDSVLDGLRYLLDFSTFDSLQALWLYIDRPNVYNAKWFFTSLASIPIPSAVNSGLRLLVITFGWTATRTLNREYRSDGGLVPWQGLDELLCTPRFDSLQEMWLNVHPCCTFPVTSINLAEFCLLTASKRRKIFVAYEASGQWHPESWARIR